MENKLGILAGGGDLPLKIVAHCQENGRPFHVIGFQGQADPENYSDVPFATVRLGAAGKTRDFLRENNIREIVLAGHVKRPSLAALRPDAYTMKFFLKTGAKSLGDDGLLSAVVKFLEEEEGLKIIGASSLLADVSHFPVGPLGTVQPNSDAIADIKRGREVLQLIGPADIGQSLAVQEGLVLGVEAIEGTDLMISRCALLKREGNGPVLIKLRKPNQETRVDMPTIGPSTIRNLTEAGFSGVALDAGGMIILDQEKTIDLANNSNIFIYAVEPLTENP